MLHDSVIMEDIYDNIFKNTQYDLMDFIQEFPNSWLDNDNACIHLAGEDGKTLFKIKIEKA